MRILRGLAGLVALVACLVGAPIGLRILGGDLIPHSLSWATVRAALLSPDTGSLLLGFITLIGWIIWLLLLLTVAVELLNLVTRQRIRIRIPGLAGPQRVIGGLLIGVVAMVVIPHAVPHATAEPVISPPGSSTSTATQSRPTHTDRSTPTEDHGTGTAAEARRENPATAEPTGSRLTHKVEQGDTLWRLADRYLGNGADWRKIAEVNHLGSSEDLAVGQNLVIPRQAAGNGGDDDAADESVTVHRGDSLSAIANDELGNPTRWTDLYDANRDEIADPDLIYPGQHLQLPDTERVSQPTTADDSDHRSVDASADHTDAGSATEGAQAGQARPRAEQRSGSSSDQPTTGPVREYPPTDSGQNQAGEPSQGDPPAVADDNPGSATASSAAPSIAALAGVGLLLTSGLAYTLRRRRQRQRNARRPGQKIPDPPDEVRTIETAVGQAHEPQIHRALTDVFRAISAWCYQHETDLPVVTAARISDTRLDLLLTEPHDNPPPGVAAGQGNRIWTVQADDVATLTSIHGADEAVQPYPTLVTLGTDDDGAHILLDLEQAGVLAIKADTPLQAVAAITAIGVELAVSPWTQDLRITFAGDLCPGLVTELGAATISHTSDIDELLDRLEDEAAAQRSHLDEGKEASSSVGQKRIDPDLGDAWAPEIILVADPLSAEQHDRITAVMTRQPHVAFAAVITGDEPSADHVLTIRAGDSGRILGLLEPQGWSVEPQLVTEELYEVVLDSITATGRTDTMPAPWWNHATADEPETTATVTVLHPARIAADEEDLPDGDGSTQTAAHVDSPDSEVAVDVAEATHPVGSGGNADLDDSSAAAVEGTGQDDLASDQTTGPVAPDAADGQPERPRFGVLLDQLPIAPDRDRDDNVPLVDQERGAETSATTELDRTVDDDGCEDDDSVTVLHPSLRILGRVDLVGARGKVERSPQRCMEILCWMLEHPGARASEIADALCLSPSTIRSSIAALRGWLGEAPDGDRYLPVAYQGGYRVDDRVTSDWQKVKDLMLPGVNVVDTADLREALALVRGRPFSGSPDWAFPVSLRTDIQSTLVDIAHELTTRCLDRSDIQGARAAVSTGLTVDPELELIMTDLLQVEHAAGNTEEVGRIRRRIQQHAAELGSDLAEETVAVLSKVASSRHRTAVRRPVSQ